MSNNLNVEHDVFRNIAEMQLTGETAVVSFGCGAKRIVFETDPIIAYAIVTYRGRPIPSELANWLSSEAKLSNNQSRNLSDYLVNNGFFIDRLDSADSYLWDKFGWADAKTVFRASYDTRWVNDYRGISEVMVRMEDGGCFGIDKFCESQHYNDFGNIEIPLPAPQVCSGNIIDIIRCRRTRRKFSNKPIQLSEIAAICRWTFGRQESCPSRPMIPTYVDNDPVYGFIIMRPDRVQLDEFSQFGSNRHVFGLYVPDSHSIRVFTPSQDFEHWSDLMWTQSYGENAGFGLMLVSRVSEYMFKYPNIRSYNWVFSDAGSFMHNAIIAAESLGLKVFQTPAVDDAFVAEILGYDPTKMVASYFGLFGK